MRQLVSVVTRAPSLDVQEKDGLGGPNRAGVSHPQRLGGDGNEEEEECDLEFTL